MPRPLERPAAPKAPSGLLCGCDGLGGRFGVRRREAWTSLKPPSLRIIAPTGSARWRVSALLLISPRSPPSALHAGMAELRPSGAPGPTAPPAPGPTAPPAFASLFPPGLHAIYGECRRLYPDQPNPLQVTAIVKYWYALGQGETDAAGWEEFKHRGRSNLRGRRRRMVKALGRRASCCEGRS